jgi:hypothetical protein
MVEQTWTRKDHLTKQSKYLSLVCTIKCKSALTTRYRCGNAARAIGSNSTAGTEGDTYKRFHVSAWTTVVY